MNVRKYRWLRRKSFVGKVLRLPFKLIPSNALLPILAGPLRGNRWIKGSHNLSVLLGTYEKIQSREFFQISRGARVLWDLGAHVGYYSLLFSKANRTGAIIAFEPVERNAKLFERHMNLNKVRNYEIKQLAVSNEVGTLSFNFGRTTVAGKLSRQGSSFVPVIKLSSWFKENASLPPNIVKMDIEGEELKVLQDIAQILRDHKPKIFLSTHGVALHHECIHFLRQLDYELKPLDAPSLEQCNELLAF